VRERPSFLTAFAAVSLSRASLRFAGFQRTLRWCRWWAGRLERDAPLGTAEGVVRTVAVAAAFFPGRAICLEQSVACHVLLRRYGHASSLRVGVQPYPFRAHAWVEVGGQPVLENEDELVKFVPFPEAFA
jgi:hypothetical protein